MLSQIKSAMLKTVHEYDYEYYLYVISSDRLSYYFVAIHHYLFNLIEHLDYCLENMKYLLC